MPPPHRNLGFSASFALRISVVSARNGQLSNNQKPTKSLMPRVISSSSFFRSLSAQELGCLLGQARMGIHLVGLGRAWNLQNG
ncbi:hypothetical protein SLA2020_109660 [Shorea laevis]